MGDACSNIQFPALPIVLIEMPTQPEVLSKQLPPALYSPLCGEFLFLVQLTSQRLWALVNKYP